MFNSLIGYSGYVGSTLIKQKYFKSLYRSTNISHIDNQIFDTVVCAGAPAHKWIANLEPDADRKKIEELISHIKTIQCKTFILISTVDVFKKPIAVDEDSTVDEAGLHAYGLNRRLLEKFVEENFPNHLIVRLPGLVGPGLRKNVIFDFLNHNNLDAIDSRGVYQFYPMVNLWYDIQTALNANLKLVHLTAEPLQVGDISLKGFGKSFTHTLNGPVASYDMQTKHGKIFGVSSRYLYNARETIMAVRAYAQSEPLMITVDKEIGV